MPWVSTKNSWKGDVQTNTHSWIFIAAQFTPSVHPQMMDKRYIVPPHKGASLSPAKGRSPDTCYHVDGPWEHDAQWDKQTQKDTRGVIPLIGNIQNRLIHKHREWVPGCQGWGGHGVTTDGDRVFDWGMVILKLVIINMYLVFVSVPGSELIKCWNFLSDKRYKGKWKWSRSVVSYSLRPHGL